MTVSVAMITFNHEKYIREAIEGVLMQKTNFQYELVIGEDHSTDGTREICCEYASLNPGIIRILPSDTNLGIMLNFSRTLRECSGKYIAICEGDDYWTDPTKLQKQVDFLNANPSFVGCFHNTEERYEDGILSSFLYVKLKYAQSISFNDLSYANLMPTCSLVFINKNIRNLPDWFQELPIGDWPLNLINAQYGNFWYIPHVMGIHRLSDKSSWALQSQKRNIKIVFQAYDKMIAGFFDKPELVSMLNRGKIRFKLLNAIPFIKLFHLFFSKIFSK